MRQLGKEVTPDNDLVSIEDMYLETQLAFAYYNTCQDKWEGNAGIYLGKDFSLIPYRLELDEVDLTTTRYIWLIMAYIDRYVSQDISKKQEAQRRAGKHGRPS